MTRTFKLTIAALGALIVLAAIVLTVLALRPAATKPAAQAGTPTAAQAISAPAATKTPGTRGWGHGVYKVGVDIDAGSYKTAGDSSQCYWNRLKNDSGNSSAIIARDIFTGPGRMTIEPTDAYVKFGGGCIWTVA